MPLLGAAPHTVCEKFYAILPYPAQISPLCFSPLSTRYPQWDDAKKTFTLLSEAKPISPCITTRARNIDVNFDSFLFFKSQIN